MPADDDVENASGADDFDDDSHADDAHHNHSGDVPADEDQSPNATGTEVIDPKREKEEAKRREKEQKAREKREKDEAKQREKDAERQRKEAAKAEKAASKQGTPRSKDTTPRTEGRLTSMFRSPASTTATPKPGVRPRRTELCRVLLLDGSDYEVSVDRNANGQALVDKVCEHVNLMERDYFSCSYRDKEGIKFWLNHDKRIRKQLGTCPWVFSFEVKFYPPEPTILQEDITRYLLCLQIRSDILSGKLPCSFVTHALLGSYTVQAELGDFDLSEHGQGIDYIRDIQFALNQTDDLLDKIAELHRTHRGQNPAEAELHYLENAKKLALFGVDLHQAQDNEQIDIMLGVSANGVMVYRDKLRVNRFAWPKILKMSYKKHTFYLKIRPAEFEQYESTIGFRLASHKLTKRLWRIAIEHHTFFRLKEPMMIQRGLFGNFGSKFRYSGRTYYQSRMAAAATERQAPDFDRTLSRRLTGSRSMDESGYGKQRGYDNMRSASMDLKSRRPQYDDDLQPEVGQVSVLAGTGPDASRVAYVKTVKPSGFDYDQQEAPHDARYANVPTDRYDEDEDTPVPASTFASNTRTTRSSRHDDLGTHTEVTVTKTTVVKGTTLQHTDSDEDLPPYPQTHGASYHGGAARMATDVDAVQDKPAVAAKPKKHKKTSKTSKRTVTGPDGTTVVTEYKTEKNGVVETRVQKRVKSTDSYDYDAALASAIHRVTDMDENLAVEKIDVKTRVTAIDDD